MSSLNRLAAPQGVLAPFAALVAGAVAMGVSPIFVRLADVGPFTSAFWRVALALPLLYAWTRLADGPEGSGERFSVATFLSGLAFAGDLFFWHLSIVHTSVANATFFATTAPIWVVLFGWLLFRQTVTAGVLAGLALCLIGGAALLAQSLELRPARSAANGARTPCGAASRLRDDNIQWIPVRRRWTRRQSLRLSSIVLPQPYSKRQGWTEELTSISSRSSRPSRRSRPSWGRSTPAFSSSAITPQTGFRPATVRSAFCARRSSGISPSTLGRRISPAPSRRA